MKKNAKFLLQCADCGLKYKKTIKWLENIEEFDCICGNTLDIYELVTDIYVENLKEVYIAYSK